MNMPSGNKENSGWSEESRRRQDESNAEAADDKSALKTKMAHVRSGKSKKAKKKARDQQKAKERNALKSITREDIEKLKRPSQHYDSKTKTYTKDPSVTMHTIESAEKELLLKGVQPKPCHLWLDNPPHPHGPFIGGLNHTYAPLNSEQLSKALEGDKCWPALCFQIGETWETFPIPPPPSKNEAPLIRDHDWETLLHNTNKHNNLDQYIPIMALCQELPLPILNIEDVDLDRMKKEKKMPIAHDTNRNALVEKLTELGLFEFDGYYEGLASAYMPDEFEGGVGALEYMRQQTDTFKDKPESLVDEDPRTYWRDLSGEKLSSDEVDIIRSNFQEIAYLAFQAGKEAAKTGMTGENLRILLQGKSMTAAQDAKKPGTLLLEKILADYMKLGKPHPKPKEFKAFIADLGLEWEGNKNPTYKNIQRFLSKHKPLSCDQQKPGA